MFVEPGESECSEDAFSATPREERFHDRVSVAERLESPRPRVGDLDADAAQQRLDLIGAAQIECDTGRKMLQHVVISTLQLSGGFGRIAGAGTDEPGDD